MEKKCSRCGLTRSVTAFSRLKTSKDGRLGMCKDCDIQRRGKTKARKVVKEVGFSEVQAAYLAGLLDGEGFIGMTRRTRKSGKYVGNAAYHARLVIGITTPVIRDVAADYGVGKVYLSRKRKKNHKDRLDWTLSSNEIRATLPAVLPYLRVKKQQAVLLLEYLRLACSERDRTGVYFAKVTQIYKGLRLLNHRGVNDGN